MTPTGTGAASVTGRQAVSRLTRFLRLQSRLEAHKPTFSKFLGLSVSPTAENGDGDDGAETVLRGESFSVSDRWNSRQKKASLVVRYRFPHRLKQLESPRNSGPSLSTYASILDDATTLGIIGAAPKNPRPGVSVVLEARWGAGAGPAVSRVGDEVDIVTSVTKLGRTLGFVRAEVRDPSNENALVCSFDHVKYLPTGWVLGLLLTPVGMWCLECILRYLGPYLPNNNHKTDKGEDEADDDVYAGILDSYRTTGDTTATFRFGQVHANGMGGLHGGVHAILMERLGKTVAQRELSKVVAAGGGGGDSSSSPPPSGALCEVDCERLKVTYQSSAASSSSRSLELRAVVLDPPRPGRPSVTLRVEIVRSGRKRSRDGDSTVVVVSEGILTFAIISSKGKKDQ